MKIFGTILISLLCFSFYTQNIFAQSAKSNRIYLIVEQYLRLEDGSTKKLDLPIEKLTRKIFKYGNYEVIIGRGGNVYPKLKIQVVARAESENYLGHGKLYSGASLHGTIELIKKDQSVQERSFYGRIKPGEYVSILNSLSYKTPDRAPIIDAFRESNYLEMLYWTINDLAGVNSIVGALKDNDFNVRASAVTVLIKLKHELSINQIEKIVNDKSPEVRRLSVELLNNRKEPQAINLLLDLLKEAQTTEIPKIIRLLAFYNDPKITDEVSKYIADKDTAIKAASIYLFANNTSQIAYETLLHLLSDSDDSIRMLTVKTIITQNDPRFIDLIIKALSDPLYDIRILSVKALGDLKAKKAVEPLVKILNSDENEYLRNAAAESLGMINDSQAIIPLMESYTEKEKIKHVRTQARNSFLLLLENIDQISSVEEALCISYTLFENDKDLQKAAIIYLLHLKDLSSINYFFQALEDTTLSTRLSAVTALGYIRNDLIIEPLISSLQNDKRWEVRYRTVESVGRAKIISAVPLLIPILKDTMADMRYITAISLGRIGDHEAVKPLIDLLGDTSRIVRYATIEALGKLKEQIIVGPLINILQNDRVLVNRNKAAEILGQIGDTCAIKPLLGILHNDKNIKLLQIAISSLGMLKAEESIGIIIQLLISNHELRAKAVDALIQINSPQMVDQLIPVLNNKDQNVRLAAANVFCEVRDRKAIEPLINAIKDAVDNKCVDAIQNALINITGENNISGYTNWLEWWREKK